MGSLRLGTNFRHFESEKIWASGLIVDEHCETPSHWNSAKTLDAWLEDNGIVGICGVDTRKLTQQIRCRSCRIFSLN